VCSARAVPSRGAPPQRSIPKSPRRVPPSRTVLYMGRALHRCTKPHQRTATEGRQSPHAVPPKPCHSHPLSPSLSPAAAAAALSLRRHNVIVGAITDHSHPCAGPAALSLALPRGVRTQNSRSAEITEKTPTSTRRTPPLAPSATTKSLGVPSRIFRTPARGQPPSHWRCPGTWGHLKPGPPESTENLPPQHAVGAAAGTMGPHIVHGWVGTDGFRLLQPASAPERRQEPPPSDVSLHSWESV
jgi:hypothetical protein